MATWMRLAYPHLINAVFSDSGPLHAQEDFPGKLFLVFASNFLTKKKLSHASATAPRRPQYILLCHLYINHIFHYC